MILRSFILKNNAIIIKNNTMIENGMQADTNKNYNIKTSVFILDIYYRQIIQFMAGSSYQNQSYGYLFNIWLHVYHTYTFDDDYCE